MTEGQRAHTSDAMRATTTSPRSLLLALAGVILIAGASGCGGPGTPEIVVTGPFTDEHAVAFDNAVDYFADPSQLEGGWRRDWEEDVDRRVSLADAIGVVEVTTVRTDVDLDRRETYRLLSRVIRERHGDLPDELTLTVRQSDPGYGTVHGNDARILNQRFIAFVKWADEDGRVVPRWHLSPASDAVIRRVNTLIERRHTPAAERRRVIIREHAVEGAGGEDDEL